MTVSLTKLHRVSSIQMHNASDVSYFHGMKVQASTRYMRCKLVRINCAA